MPAMSNFTQAMKELTGFDDEQQTSAGGGMNPSVPDPQFKGDHSEPMVPSYNADMEMPSFNENSGTYVTPTMVIKGNITSRTDLKIDGKVSGNIDSTAAAEINGTVVGDIKADGIFVSGAVKGELNSRTNIKMNTNAVVVGNAKADNISVYGKIKGDLDVKEVTEVAAHAMVAGNIVTDRLVSDGGSFVGGSITTRETEKFEIDEDKIFDIGE